MAHSGSAATTAPTHPNAWDSRVKEYVDVVEDQRDLEFKHPIYVDFLSVKAFKKQVTSDEDDLTDKDREEIKQATSMFRALGLIEGEIDLFDTMNELQGAGIVGYYDYETERIRIRGTKLTPTVQSTLVHELTHALQDQHFDLEKRTGQAGEGRRLRCVQRLRFPRRGRREPDRDGVARGPEQGRAEGARQVRGRADGEVQGRLRRHPRCARDDHGCAVRLR